MSIDCCFFGFLASDAERRTSQAGKAWTRLRVGVGRDDDLVWVSVACFGKAAAAAGGLKKGDRIYCEGSIKCDTWRGQDGVERHGLSVACFKIDKTHQIGRNRPKRERERDDGERPSSPQRQAGAGLNDEIPF